jgi:beta-glucanase (GH16 family)
VGATVTLSGPVNATTAVTGSSTFAFSGLPAGSYTVTPSGTNTTFTPVSQGVSISSANVTVPNFSVASTEKVIFFDNFPQPTLSPDWTVISRHGEYAQNETECNIPQEVTAGSGLTITTAAENWTCGDFNIDSSTRHAPSSWPYITGDVQWTSQNFTYGTVEVRAKFPSYTTSLWPAIWMLGSNCQTTNIFTADLGYSGCPLISEQSPEKYQEIDMVECYNGAYGFCQFHVANPSFGIGGGCDAHYTVDTNWHTFTTVWTASGIRQYMDGVLETTCNQSMSNPMFLIIQTQTGGSGGTPNNADLPAQLKIDYVKVTQP